MKIPLIPGLIIALVSLISNIISCTVLYILKLPLPYFYSLWYSLSVMLTAFPQSVREFLKLYDANGLRHHVAHLKDNKVFRRVAVADIREQLNYVDRVTKTNYPRKPREVKKNIAYRPLSSLGGSVYNITTFPPTGEALLPAHIDMTQLNTTSIGNMAWMAIYHTDENHRNFYTEKLVDIKEYFSTML